jgi:hypothetical protein
MDYINPWQCDCGTITCLAFKEDHITKCNDYNQKHKIDKWDGTSEGAYNASKNLEDRKILIKQIQRVIKLSDEVVIKIIENARIKVNK